MFQKRILFGVAVFLFSIATAFYRAGAVSAVFINEQNLRDSVSKHDEKSAQVSAPIQLDLAKTKILAQREITPSAQEIFSQLNEKTLIVSNSGWLHGKEYRTHDVDSTNFGVLPNGKELPLEQITEYWFYINDSGFIERSVTIIRGTDGQVVQVGINSNGTSWNTATDEIVPHDLYPFEGFDYGLHYYLTRPELQFSNYDDQDGKQVTVFSIFVGEENPVTLDEYSSRLTGMEHHYYFDTNTGFFIQSETIAHLDDGSQRRFESIQSEFELGKTPPPEVFAYLDQKQVRESEK